MTRAAFAAALVGCAVMGVGTVRADDRLNLAIPDLGLYESAFHLDRDTPYEFRTHEGWTGWAGGGAARVDDGTTDASGNASPTRSAGVASAGFAAGRQGEQLIAVWASEIYGVSGRGIRGRHRGLIEARTRYDDDIGIDGTISGGVEHGHARGLGPVRVGPGERVTGDLSFETMMRIGKRKGDMHWVGLVGADTGGTAWEAATAPWIAKEEHNGATLGLAGAPGDGELPRGRLELTGPRVEQQQSGRAAGRG